MPMDPKKYPADWKKLSYDLRQNRAKQRCEHPECGAPNGFWIQRHVANKERFILSPKRMPAMLPWSASVRVVLTCAHTCDCRPICGNPDHIKVLCQLHHLRLDAKQHATNARETKRAKKLGPILPGLPD